MCSRPRIGRQPDPALADARRQQILDAAADCFRRHGYHGASMAQICRTAGMSAGVDHDYLPKDDPRILAHTKLVGGGESTSVTFKTDGLAGKDLTFFCSFPGHFALMKGSFKVG